MTSDRVKVIARLHVRPVGEHTIVEWLHLNKLVLPARKVRSLGRVILEGAVYLVEAEYEAIGASAADVMRPYNTSKRWSEIAEVHLVEATREVVPRRDQKEDSGANG